MPEADASDVRHELNTDLDDSEITTLLERVERDITREYDADAFDDTGHQRDFEATLTALRIATGRDRRISSGSGESTSIEFEGSELAALRSRVARLDPGDAFSAGGGVRRDSDRHVRATDREDEYESNTSES